MQKRSELKINIVILNYNGEDLLKECLPSVLEAAENSSFSCVVTVLDNKSSDNSVEYVRKNFKNVKVFMASQNKVLCSYNEIFADINDDFVIMLNNDMKAEKDFIDPLVEMFLRHEDALVVSPKCLSFDKTIYEGTRAKPFFRLGMFSAVSRYSGHENETDLPGLTMQSPFGLFDRKKYLFLNGFDEIYLPGIMEEADLCYRAYRSGFKCYYQPKSLIYHKGQVTFKKYYSTRAALAVAHRNSFLFMWKNISDPFLMARHILLIPVKIVLGLVRGKTEILSGFFMALSMISVVMKKRKDSLRSFTRSDREVLNEVAANLVSAQ